MAGTPTIKVEEDEHDDALDPCALATIIVLWLRMLPVPLVPFDTANAFLACHVIDVPEARSRNVRNLVDTLPVASKASFAFLLRFFSLWFDASSNDFAERLDASQLATCFFDQRESLSQESAATTRLFVDLVGNEADFLQDLTQSSTCAL